jgi:SRSO17 transposase
VAQRYLHGLAQAEAATFAAMAAVVEDGCEQQFQHFISNAPWRHEPVIAQIGRDADRLLGGKADSALILDESRFVKQGDRSVGVARQWCGRLGKVDNCQVAVFAVLTDGARHTPVDMRLYLPQRWIDDPARCDRAEIPMQARTTRAKSVLALEMVRAARTRGMRFGWVGVDGGYGKDPAFLRALDEMGEVFVADVHGTQRVWSEPPGLHVPAPQSPRGCPPSKQQAAVDGITVEKLVAGFGADDWKRCVLRESTRGPLRVDVAHRRVWVWDGEEATARCWHLIVRRELGAPKKIKYSLSNAPADTSLERLAQMQGALLGRAGLRGCQGRMRACRLPGGGLASLAPPRHHGDAGHVVHRRAAGGASARPGVADATRYRRDAEGDAAAQAAGQGGAGRPNQPASRPQT